MPDADACGTDARSTDARGTAACSTACSTTCSTDARDAHGTDAHGTASSTEAHDACSNDLQARHLLLHVPGPATSRWSLTPLKVPQPVPCRPQGPVSVSRQGPHSRRDADGGQEAGASPALDSAGRPRPRAIRTQVFASPHVHHHVVLPQFFEIELVHDEEPAGNHGGSKEAGRGPEVGERGEVPGGARQGHACHADGSGGCRGPLRSSTAVLTRPTGRAAASTGWPC